MGYLGLERTDEFVRRYWTEEQALPKHERLRQAFSASIADGFWRAGMRLPTEAELTARAPCSLGTVQRALRALADDGLIERRRGSGSVVADMGARIADPWHIRYVDPASDGSQYLPVETRVLARRLLTEPGRWSEPLGQKDGAALKIDRIFTVGRQIEVYSEFFALADRFPDLAEFDLKHLDGVNFKQLLARNHGLPFHRMRQRMRLQVPPDHVADVLKGDCDTPVPVFNIVAIGPTGEPNYYQDFYLPLVEGELDLGFATRS